MDPKEEKKEEIAMFFKKKVFALLGELKDTMDTVLLEERTRIILEAEINRLKEENQQLLDRIMATSWESYKTYTAEGFDETPGEEIPLGEDDEMAGEVLEIKD